MIVRCLQTSLCDTIVWLFRFPVDERNTMKSVVEYFSETYGFVIQHTQWPCLQVGNTQRPNYLPMEVSGFIGCRWDPYVWMLIGCSWVQVCKIVEGQRYSKRLNERQITALLKVTCQRPHDRERDILQVCLNESVLYSAYLMLEAYGVFCCSMFSLDTIFIHILTKFLLLLLCRCVLLIQTNYRASFLQYIIVVV